MFSLAGQSEVPKEVMADATNLKPSSEVRSDNRIVISLASVVCTPAELLGHKRLVAGLARSFAG